jgi:hypothetical protein
MSKLAMMAVAAAMFSTSVLADAGRQSKATRLSDAQLDQITAGAAPANPPRGQIDPRVRARARALGRLAQGVLGKGAGRHHDHADAGLKQNDQVLADRLVRGGLEHRLRPPLEQGIASDDEGHAELGPQGSAAGSGAASGDGDNLHARQRATGN